MAAFDPSAPMTRVRLVTLDLTDDEMVEESIDQAPLSTPPPLPPTSQIRTTTKRRGD